MKVLLGCLCRNADTLKRLQETEKKLKEQQTKAYISMDISNGEREKGNQVFDCPSQLQTQRGLRRPCKLSLAG